MYAIRTRTGGVGEVVNTPDCGSGMHGFDPHIPPQIAKNELLIVRFFFWGAIRKNYFLKFRGILNYFEEYNI